MSSLALLTRDYDSIKPIINAINSNPESINKVKLVIKYPFQSQLSKKYSKLKKLDINIYRIFRKTYHLMNKGDKKIINVSRVKITNLDVALINMYLLKNNIDVMILKNAPIMPPKLIEEISVKMYNFHSGLLPAYKGVSCGLWPVINNDMDNIGVSLHEVDKNIDSGNILVREKIKQPIINCIYPFDIAKKQETLIGDVLLKYDFNNISFVSINKYEFENSCYYGHVGITDLLIGYYYLLKNKI